METTTSPFAVADLCDHYAHKGLQVVQPLLRHFGGRRAFGGQIETVVIHDGSGLVRGALSRPGHGRVLVADAAGAFRALFGGNLAKLALDNGWRGVVINGYIRDSVNVAAADVGVMALGTHPQKSERADIGREGEVVRFGGTVFVPGRWLYADEDGIAVSAEELPYPP